MKGKEDIYCFIYAPRETGAEEGIETPCWKVNIVRTVDRSGGLKTTGELAIQVPEEKELTKVPEVGPLLVWERNTQEASMPKVEWREGQIREVVG